MLNSTLTTLVERAEFSCPVEGQPDLYGLGIRIGIYIQMLAVQISGLLSMVLRQDDYLGESVVLFILAVSSVLIKLIVHKQILAVEAAPMVALLLAQVSVCRAVSQMGFVVGIIFAVEFCGLSSLFVWFWWHGMDVLGHSPCADDKVFFFAKYLLYWYQRLRGRVGPLEQNNGDQNSDRNDNDWKVDLQSAFEISINIGVIAFVEMTLKWNNITNVHSLRDPGQFMPLMISLAQLVAIIYQGVSRVAHMAATEDEPHIYGKFSPFRPRLVDDRCERMLNMLRAQSPLATNIPSILSIMVSASRLMALSASIRVALTTGIRNMDNLVTFGDSYTDESRAIYLAEYGHVPPAGLLMPPNNRTADGGIAWGRMVANMTGASYYNYAVAGSTCSEKVATQPARIIPGQIPTLLEYEVPAFEADLAVASFYPNRQPNNTVYAMWIGTNDLGIEGFLHDRNRPGTVLDDFVGCVWESFDRIYKTGGRRFVVMKAVPLEKAPTYASFDNGGARDNPVWPTKSQYNTTEYQHKMFQYSQAVNELLDYTTPFHLLLKRRWPGASVTVFDTHSIFNDIHDNPGQYLSSPQNVIKLSLRPEDAVTFDQWGKDNCVGSPLHSSHYASQDYTLVLGAEDDAVAEVKGKARKGHRS
ncbi:hypothetical protein NHJ13734_004128 [Beauveria thailandica]